LALRVPFLSSIDWPALILSLAAPVAITFAAAGTIPANERDAAALAQKSERRTNFCIGPAMIPIRRFTADEIRPFLCAREVKARARNAGPKGRWGVSADLVCRAPLHFAL
jgi:hypothetical protein